MGEAMSAILTRPGLLDADEWDVPDGYELIDGRLVETPVGAESSLVAGQIYRRIAAFLDTRPLGVALPGDVGYRCFPHRPRLLRKPDASYIAGGRLAGNRVPTGDFRIAPDLVVEVVSPNDLAEAVQEKIDDYLAAGVRLIWIIYPTQRTATVYSPTTCAYVPRGGELSGGDVIPGFQCRLEDILQPPNPSGSDDASAAS
jgi:Uma2 family endonuclease